MDPMHQFQVAPLFSVGGVTISNASASMVIATTLISAFLILVTRRINLIPGKGQVILEQGYSFIKNIITDLIGEKGVKFVPHALALFLFIVSGNVLGLIPGFFTFTSRLEFVFALALLLFSFIIFLGIKNLGKGFVSIFVPHGIAKVWLLLLVPIEVLSYCFRPISLSLRLCANMMAGHIILKVFASFSAILMSKAALLSLVPLCLNTTLMFFEGLVALLQAYIFTVLACIYLKDALYFHE